MGCDGGTIPKRHELVKGPRKVEKVAGGGVRGARAGAAGPALRAGALALGPRPGRRVGPAAARPVLPVPQGLRAGRGACGRREPRCAACRAAAEGGGCRRVSAGELRGPRALCRKREAEGPPSPCGAAFAGGSVNGATRPLAVAAFWM